MPAAKRCLVLAIGALTLPAHPATLDRVGVPLTARMANQSGTLHITQDNTVVSNLEIRGNVIVDADHVLMQNVRVISTTQFSALRVMDDAEGFSLTDSEIDGGGITANAIDGHGTFLRNKIHGAENGINITGPSLVEANHIYDLRNKHGSPHYDGIQVDGGHDITIIGNTIINENDQTSAVMLDNYFSGLSNITVKNNRLVGGGYTIYVDGRFGGGAVIDATIRILNNRIERGFYGSHVFYDQKPIFDGNMIVDKATTHEKSASDPN